MAKPKSDKPKKLSEFPANKTNPFVDKMLSQMSNVLVERRVLGANQDEGAILRAVDGDGQILGNTVFMRNKTVDNDNFLKIYSDELRKFFELKPASIKVFMYILHTLKSKVNQDAFILIPDEVMEATGIKRTALYSSLAELCTKDIIARGRIDYEYYINPSVCFNGDRVSFATTYINTNYPQYETSRGHLKGTIDTMKMDRILPEYPTMEEALFNEEYDARKPIIRIDKADQG